MAQILKNNVSGVLGLALGAEETSMTLLDASSFPAPPEGDFYLLTLIGLNANGQEASWEIVKVTGKASNTLTVARAQEGTPAAAWPVATTVQLRLTAGSVVTPDVAALKEPAIAAGTAAQYWRGDKSWQTLNKTAVGLGNVDNTSDADKPVSTATQTALNLKADASVIGDISAALTAINGA